MRLKVFNSFDLLIFLFTQYADSQPQLLFLLSPNLGVFFGLALDLFQLRNGFLDGLDARQSFLLGAAQSRRVLLLASLLSSCSLAWASVS